MDIPHSRSTKGKIMTFDAQAHARLDRFNGLISQLQLQNAEQEVRIQKLEQLLNKELTEARRGVTDEFDTEANKVTVRGEAAIIQHDIDQSQLTVDQAIRLGYIKGPVSTTGIVEGGALPTPIGSDRPAVEREDSVGRRRRRQEYDGLGVLHEEGGDQ